MPKFLCDCGNVIHGNRCYDEFGQKYSEVDCKTLYKVKVNSVKIDTLYEMFDW